MQSAPAMLVQVAGMYAGFGEEVTVALEEGEVDGKYQERLNGAEDEGGAEQAGKGGERQGVQPLAPANLAAQQVRERDAVQKEEAVAGDHAEAPARRWAAMEIPMAV